MPIIWLNTIDEKLKIENDKKTEADNDNEDNEENKVSYEEYECPVFKTSKRTSIISSSGRSEEHILSIVRIHY